MQEAQGQTTIYVYSLSTMCIVDGSIMEDKYAERDRTTNDETVNYT